MLEILCDEELKGRLVHTLKMVNIRQVKDFDTFKDGMKRNITEDKRSAGNIEAARRRFQGCVRTTRSGYARQWYEEQIDVCDRLMDQREERIREQARENEEDKRDDQDEWTIVGQKKKSHIALGHEITIPRRRRPNMILQLNSMMEDVGEKDERRKRSKKSDTQDDWTMEDDQTVNEENSTRNEESQKVAKLEDGETIRELESQGHEEQRTEQEDRIEEDRVSLSI